jgi:hypothetical protein
MIANLRMKFADDEGLRKVFDLSSPMQMLKKLQWGK